MGHLHECPGCGKRAVERHRFACTPCWHRLDEDLKRALVENPRRNTKAHSVAKHNADTWFKENPLPRRSAS